MSIGSSVRKYRIAKNYSQKKLASLLEIAQTTISNIESDKNIPNAILLCKIAEALEIDLGEIFDYPKTINDIEKKIGMVIIEQYESKLSEQEQTINYLRKENQQLLNFSKSQ